MSSKVLRVYVLVTLTYQAAWPRCEAPASPITAWMAPFIPFCAAYPRGEHCSSILFHLFHLPGRPRDGCLMDVDDPRDVAAQDFLSFLLNIILLIENSPAFVFYFFVYRILEARSSLDSPALPATHSITWATLQLVVPLSWGLR